jgi:(S)-2-hydroxyglutarate dehydrogenase
LTELPRTADFAVVGGGVIGLTLALELRRRHPSARIAVLEKEAAVGAHASGRNSGVLHAGFYYGADSLKARLTREGNRRMAAWCEEHGLAIRRTGKLVVAKNEGELARLDELLRRGRVNGVELEMVSAGEARLIEPLAATRVRALFSPATAAVEPGEVMQSLAEACVERGIAMCVGTQWLAPERTDRGPIAAGYWINCAGLYADRVAHAYGFGARYAIVPFKGLYLYGNDAAPRLGVQVYPVPDLALPFLGVHFTVTAAGHVKIGPTALPAWWREQYGSGARILSGFRADELAEVAMSQLRLLASSRAVRRHALREPSKAFRRVLVAEAQKLVPSARAEQFDRWGKPGIRAQLVDRERGELVTDFVYEADARSLHVLNAVSPAFTCSFALAELLADEIVARTR